MGDNSSQGISTNISWTPVLEEYFASTGEKASGLAWVHKRSEAIYTGRRTYIDLPVIIGSGLIAFLNAGSSTLFDDPKISSVALGVGSLCLGILNSFGSYFGWAKRAEGHRISSIHYAKLNRFISVELTLPRTERSSPHDLLKYVKDQYDRLAEISPMVPDVIIHEFQRKFKNTKGVSKPEETNGIHKIDVYTGVDDDESMKELPELKSPTPSIRAAQSFESLATPKELPKMAVRIPDSAKKVQPKKVEPVVAGVPKKSDLVVAHSKEVVSEEQVIVEIPKTHSPHED
jgi:hypothetical protein